MERVPIKPWRGFVRCFPPPSSFSVLVHFWPRADSEGLRGGQGGSLWHRQTSRISLEEALGPACRCYELFACGETWWLRFCSFRVSCKGHSASESLTWSGGPFHPSVCVEAVISHDVTKAVYSEGHRLFLNRPVRIIRRLPELNSAHKVRTYGCTDTGHGSTRLFPSGLHSHCRHWSTMHWWLGRGSVTSGTLMLLVLVSKSQILPKTSELCLCVSMSEKHWTSTSDQRGTYAAILVKIVRRTVSLLHGHVTHPIMCSCVSYRARFREVYRAWAQHGVLTPVNLTARACDFCSTSSYHKPYVQILQVQLWTAAVTMSQQSLKRHVLFTGL